METILTMPILLLLVGGIYEYVRIGQTRATLEYAALMSARFGATDRARPAALHEGLERGLAPLYGGEAVSDSGTVCIIESGGWTCPSGGSAPDLAPAARNFAKSERADGMAEVVILNPTGESFSALSVESGPQYEGVPYIPNAGLQRMNMRDNVALGEVQDANLLKVLVIYGYEPVVPMPWLTNMLADIGLAAPASSRQTGTTLHASDGYADGDYNLSEGCYSMADLEDMGLGNDSLESITVVDGYEITLYEHAASDPSPGWEMTVDEDTELTDSGTSRLCVNRTASAPDHDFADRISQTFTDTYGAAGGGIGFNKIRAAADKIREAGRIPLLATATVRMQSPFHYSDHVLSNDSEYFVDAAPTPADRVIPRTQGEGGDGSTPPTATPPEPPEPGDYDPEECDAVDSALAGTTQAEIEDPSSEPYIKINNGMNGTPSLVDQGFWPADQDARRDLILEMQTACAHYDGLMPIDPDSWYIPPPSGDGGGGDGGGLCDGDAPPSGGICAPGAL